MRYAALFVLALAACSGAPPARPDAPEDAPGDAAGSGSNASVAMETSPQDTHLEMMVVGLCVVIALAPTLGTTRRRMT